MSGILLHFDIGKEFKRAYFTDLFPNSTSSFTFWL